MPEFGFPAQFRQAAMRSVITSMRDRSDDARVAAVTERYADVTRELDGRVNELMQVEKSINDLRAYGEIIAVSETRASIMQNSLEDVRTLAQDVVSTVTTVLTAGNDSNFETVSQQAKEALESMIGRLNVSFGGRALFAGDDAGGNAVVDADQILTDIQSILEGAATAPAGYNLVQAEFMNAGATFDTSWYLGGTGGAPRAEIGPGEVVDYTVRADETAIREVLFNVSVIIESFDTSNTVDSFQRRDLLETATDGLRNAIGDVAGLQSRLGTTEARISTVKARNIANDASLTLAFNELAGADSYVAAVELTQLESQLEVAFATTSRLANLTLANFR